jgi:hypothetical protein
MSVSRVVSALLGTSESVGISLATGVSSTGSEVDVFGNDTTEGWGNLFLWYDAPSGSVGTLDVTLLYGATTGNQATDQVPLVASVTPTASGSQLGTPLGQVPLSRFMKGKVLNNATTKTVANITLLLEYFKES